MVSKADDADKVALNVYVGLVFAAGMVLLGRYGFMFRPDHAIDLAFFGVLGVFAELFPVRLPRGIYVSVSFAILYATTLVAGPSTGAWVAAIAGVVHSAHTRTGLQKWAFNFGQIVVVVVACGAVYEAFGIRGIPDDLGRMAVPAFAAGLTYFVLNSLLVSGAVSLSTGASLWRVWHVSLASTYVSFVGLSILGGLMAIAYRRIGFVSALIIFAPLMVARYAVQQTVKITQSHYALVESLTAALEAKDGYTSGHSMRVSALAVKIARRMRLPESRVEIVEYAGMLHDIGKIGIKDELLNKASPLTSDDFNTIRSHVVKGAEIVAPAEFLSGVAEIIKCHHERYDGRGYPSGLAGDAIPVEARILAVADAFDAMISDRPYRKGLGEDEAVRRLVAAAGTQFDPAVVRACLEVLGKGEAWPHAR